MREPVEFLPVAELEKKRARVVFQGVEGAYGHAAVKQYFGSDQNAYHVAKFEDTVREIEEGRADYAVLPIENSTAGFVNGNYDLLSKCSDYIVGEVYVRIDHMLLGIPGAELSGIRTVYSHPQALAQCSDYLNQHREWQQVSVLNTAAAAQKVMEEQDRAQAAVASRTAGELYGLEELAGVINNVKGNTTRFAILSSRPFYEKSASKISLIFEVPHVSGSLYKILGHFISNGINISMLQSRPIPEKPFQYRFFMDIEGNLGSGPVQDALECARKEAVAFRILGNY
ncbi:MAG: prephenate dehydratase [Lachnospiraceae bacterium]|nr:prephenate dehydratase [Lachnospiraceae bacterium]